MQRLSKLGDLDVERDSRINVFSRVSWEHFRVYISTDTTINRHLIIINSWLNALVSTVICMDTHDNTMLWEGGLERSAENPENHLPF